MDSKAVSEKFDAPWALLTLPNSFQVFHFSPFRKPHVSNKVQHRSLMPVVEPGISVFTFHEDLVSHRLMILIYLVQTPEIAINHHDVHCHTSWLGTPKFIWCPPEPWRWVESSLEADTFCTSIPKRAIYIFMHFISAFGRECCTITSSFTVAFSLTRGQRVWWGNSSILLQFPTAHCPSQKENNHRNKKQLLFIIPEHFAFAFITCIQTRLSLFPSIMLTLSVIWLQPIGDKRKFIPQFETSSPSVFTSGCEHF